MSKRKSIRAGYNGSPGPQFYLNYCPKTYDSSGPKAPKPDPLMSVGLLEYLLADRKNSKGTKKLVQDIRVAASRQRWKRVRNLLSELKKYNRR